MAIQIKDRRTEEQDRGQTQTQTYRGLGVGAELPVNNVTSQRQAGERDANRSHRSVVPLEAIGAAHQPCRNKNTQRHRDQKKLADKERGGRLWKRIENVVQGIGGPGQLPRAEVGLPALLVQISEYQKQQNRDKS